jgi:hypothetical protein
MKPNSYIDCTELFGRYHDHDFEPYGTDSSVSATGYRELRLREHGAHSGRPSDAATNDFFAARFLARGP